MQTIRQIVDAEQLAAFMNIPEDMRHIKVEIIVLPVNQKNSTDMNSKINHEALEKVYGSLHDYANPVLISKEKNAWQMAIMKNAGKGTYGRRFDYT
jgi:hypothetical protein